jgi:hypothetical protein
VRAVEHPEHARHRRLHAEGDAREAGLAQLRQGARIDGVGVGLRGHLGAGREPQLVPDGAQQPRQLLGRQQRRGAAADEDRVDVRGARAEHLARPADLGDGGVDERRLEVGQAGVGVEVAVAAARRAERHVQVDAEGPGAQAVQRAARQRTVGGDGLAVGQGAGHASSVRAAPVASEGSEAATHSPPTRRRPR